MMSDLMGKLCVLVFVALLVAAIPAACAATFHVAPDGNDAWSGRIEKPNAARTDGPLASLEGARDAVRRLNQQGPLTEPVRILIGDGSYALNKTLVLGSMDSGTEDCPISYEAAEGAKPVFSGGKAIGGFKPVGDGLWAADIPEVKSGDLYFAQLWVNGRRATRARSPNKFYYYAVGKVTHSIDPVTGEAANLQSRAFIARPEDIEPLLDAPQDLLSDVTLVAYHSWEVSRHRLAGVDPKTNMIVTTGPAPWPFMRWNAAQRYHIENFKGALDEPGEWFLDRNGTLYYKPLPGKDMTKAEVVAPTGEQQFVRFVGEPELGLTVDNITIKDLAFRHAQYILPEKGHGDSQAAQSIEGAIMADGARNVTIQDCEIGHVGVYGIWFRRGCTNCRVEKCYLHDLGAGGVRFGVGWHEDLSDPALHTGYCVADNNIIHGGGRLFPGCTGMWIGHSGDNQLTHNDVSDLFYTGLSVGWNWGYSHSLAVRNKIAFNHVHHIGQGVLSDMGGIYTLGISPGTTITDNVFHDVYSYDRYGRGGWGLYNDQASTDIVMENNLIYNTKTGGYHLHFGKDLVIRNNIFVNSMDGQLQRSRVEDHLSFTFSNNIVYWNGGTLFHGTWKDDHIIMEDNLYWDASGEEVKFHDWDLEEWRKRQEPGAQVADPLFVDPENYDFRLKPESPAIKMGFKPFDYSKAGVYGDPDWVALARSFEFEPVEFAPPPPPPPPLEVKDDFELTPVGGTPALAQVHTEKKGDFIHVTDAVAAEGKHSLMIQDAPGLQHEYDPHFLYLPSHTKGFTRCSFDMRIEDGVRMYHEWRSWDVKPYRVGPSFDVEKGKLLVGGEVLLELPIGEWFHIEITAGVGEQADGAWSLTVTLPGAEPRRFEGLETGSPKFKNLTWVGWSSTATEKAVYYLDNIRIESE